MSIRTLSEHELVIQAGAQVSPQKFFAESDISSAFSVAALAVASGGSAHFDAWPKESLQPDIRFARILGEMGCAVMESSTGAWLRVEAGARLRAISCDLKESPDLFPVLSVLCALAEGTSHLSGAPHLAYKESSRVEKTAELVRLMGARVEVLPGGMTIIPSCKVNHEFNYHPENDHRLAMAAAVARAAGFSVRIENPSVVTKSFPEFWTIADGQVR
jgi:3-phosphoshikimate 1-carboxyvinyltransferase